MIWFGGIVMALMGVWMFVLATDDAKFAKHEQTEKEKQIKQIEQKPVEEKPKKIKIK